ncbi:MAG: LPS export ABC transporter periplasmic protein LptC [Leptothrix sp. (in: b-proteobacteria)]
MSPVDDDNAPLPLPPLGLRPDVPPLTPQPWSAAQVLSALSTYLPVVLMALLAIVTWWLLKQSPEPEVAQGTRPLRHVPDYELRGFSVQRQSASNAAAGVLEGERVRHYPDTDTLEIDAVRLRWRDADGRYLLATAKRAVAQADASVLVLEGDARVVREAARAPSVAAALEGERFEFRSEWLQIDTRKQRVESDRPVVVTLGRSRFDARSVVYEYGEHSIDLGGPVHGSLAPVVAAATEVLP